VRSEIVEKPQKAQALRRSQQWRQVGQQQMRTSHKKCYSREPHKKIALRLGNIRQQTEWG